MSHHRPCVLDASAMLALFNSEPGWNAVLARLGGSSISAVNWSEVLQKRIQAGLPADLSGADLSQLGVTVQPFTVEDAATAARVWGAVRKPGLSIADRACIALAIRMNAPALTGDRAWVSLDLPVNVEVFR